jgi:hypothetical protein
VNCVTKDPASDAAATASLAGTAHLERVSASGSAAAGGDVKKFVSQRELGYYLMDHYKIRKANELASCEVCHR